MLEDNFYSESALLSPMIGFLPIPEHPVYNYNNNNEIVRALDRNSIFGNQKLYIITFPTVVAIVQYIHAKPL